MTWLSVNESKMPVLSHPLHRLEVIGKIGIPVMPIPEVHDQYIGSTRHRDSKLLVFHCIYIGSSVHLLEKAEVPIDCTESCPTRVNDNVMSSDNPGTALHAK